jgi:phage-related protein
MVLLHGFIKKTRKTAKSDIELALKRKKDVTA